MDLLYHILELKVDFLGSYQKIPHNSLLRPVLLSMYMEWKDKIAPCQILVMTTIRFSNHNFLQRVIDSVHGAKELGNKLEDVITISKYNIRKSNGNFV